MEPQCSSIGTCTNSHSRHSRRRRRRRAHDIHRQAQISQVREQVTAAGNGLHKRAQVRRVIDPLNRVIGGHVPACHCRHVHIGVHSLARIVVGVRQHFARRVRRPGLAVAVLTAGFYAVGKCGQPGKARRLEQGHAGLAGPLVDFLPTQRTARGVKVLANVPPHLVPVQVPEVPRRGRGAQRLERLPDLLPLRPAIQLLLERHPGRLRISSRKPRRDLVRGRSPAATEVRGQRREPPLGGHGVYCNPISCRNSIPVSLSKSFASCR